MSESYRRMREDIPTPSGSGSFAADVNEVQTVTVPGTVTTFNLTYNGATSGTLTTATASGIPFTPVLDIAKKQAPDGKTYLEITAVHANDWLPADR